MRSSVQDHACVAYYMKYGIPITRAMQIRHNPPAWATVQSISESYRINITILLRLTWRMNFKNHTRIQDIPNMNRVVTTPYCKTMTPLIVRTHQALQNQSKNKKKTVRTIKKTVRTQTKKQLDFYTFKKQTSKTQLPNLGNKCNRSKFTQTPD